MQQLSQTIPTEIAVGSFHGFDSEPASLDDHVEAIVIERTARKIIPVVVWNVCVR